MRRYAPQGIHTWEIWNEPNLLTCWRPAVDPAGYVQLLQVTVAAMRQEDPQAFIVSGGLAPAASDAGNLSQLDFLAQMCALGANHLVDAIGYHPYTYPVTPQDEATWNPWAQIARTNPSFRTILTQYGTPSLPVWATEYGAPTGGPGTPATADGYASATRPFHVDEAFQAILATDAVAAALQTPGLGALIWFSDEDLGTDPSTRENFFGLRRADGTAKPAFAALQSAIAQRAEGPLPSDPTMPAFPLITITSPSPGDSWATGKSYTVSWTIDQAVSGGQFMIWLVSSAGTWYLGQPVNPLPAQTSYGPVKVSVNVPAGSGYQVVVRWRADPTVASGRAGPP